MPELNANDIYFYRCRSMLLLKCSAVFFVIHIRSPTNFFKNFCEKVAISHFYVFLIMKGKLKHRLRG